MKQIFILFSHKLTEVQEVEIKEKLGCEKINYLPEQLQELWSNVDINIDNENIFKNYLKDNGNKNDYVLIQGEWGLTYKIIEFCKKNSFIPIYSYSKRKVLEEKQDENIKKTSFFKHIKFMKY